MIDELKNIFRGENAFLKLIVINAVFFIVGGLVDLGSFLTKSTIPDPFRYLAVPSDISTLIFRPWSLITYMFIHAGFRHIFLNMIMLYFSGRIFTDFMGQTKLISTYIAGGISGALVFIISYNIFPVFSDHVHNSVLVGASASVFAILIAVVTFAPNYGFYFFMFGPIRLKYIALIFLLLDIFTIPVDNPGGHISHLGGALYGYLFATQLKKGTNITAWLDRIFSKSSRVKTRPKSKLKVVHKKTRSDEEFLEIERKKQELMDQILDKIARSGYPSLTAEEKDFLFKMSKDK